MNPFKKFYSQFNDEKKKKFREGIQKALEISDRNFYHRLNAGKWKTYEKKAIAKVVNTPVTELFPEPENEIV